MVGKRYGTGSCNNPYPRLVLSQSLLTCSPLSFFAPFVTYSFSLTWLFICTKFRKLESGLK